MALDNLYFRADHFYLQTHAIFSIETSGHAIQSLHEQHTSQMVHTDHVVPKEIDLRICSWIVTAMFSREMKIYSIQTPLFRWVWSPYSACLFP